MRNVYNSMQDDFGNAVIGIPAGQLNNLSQVGVSFDMTTPGHNHLVVNTAALESALASNPLQVQKVFGFSATSSSSLIANVDRPNSLTVTYNNTPYTLAGPLSGSSGAQTVTVPATIIAGLIQVPNGGPFAGFSFGYTGGVVAGAPVTATVTPTQGIGDQLYAAAQSALDPVTGSIQGEVQMLTSQDTNFNQQIAQSNQLLAQYQQQLLNQYNHAATQVQSLSHTMEYLQAQMQAMWGSNSH
jgi:flagellar capping protein FliD